MTQLQSEVGECEAQSAAAISSDSGSKRDHRETRACSVPLAITASRLRGTPLATRVSRRLRFLLHYAV